MSTAPPSPAPCPEAPHPALLLAEVVGVLLSAILGRAWLWRWFPGGRAFEAQMRRFGREFAAIMARIAAGLPVAPMRAVPDAVPGAVAASPVAPDADTTCAARRARPSRAVNPCISRAASRCIIATQTPARANVVRRSSSMHGAFAVSLPFPGAVPAPPTGFIFPRGKSRRVEPHYNCYD
ncbi:MAG: hypothetical protein NT133_12095 [Alphaproteobacteria bacterium]|nr:hypothetical protein [Alphaproteobacteria bacterium]